MKIETKFDVDEIVWTVYLSKDTGSCPTCNRDDAVCKFKVLEAEIYSVRFNGDVTQYIFDHPEIKVKELYSKEEDVFPHTPEGKRQAEVRVEVLNG